MTVEDPSGPADEQDKSGGALRRPSDVAAEALVDLADALGFSLDELSNIYGIDPAELGRELSLPPDLDDPEAASRTLAEADKDKGAPPTPARGVEDLRVAQQRARLKNEEQDTDLRRLIAWWSVGAASVMLLLGTGVFVAFMVSQWRAVPTEGVIAYLSSTVIEILGIVYVVANYLFPRPKDE